MSVWTFQILHRVEKVYRSSYAAQTLFIRIPHTVYVLFKIMLEMSFRHIRNIFKKGKNVEKEGEKKKKEEKQEEQNE